MDDKTKVINAKWLIKDNMFSNNCENVEDYVKYIDSSIDKFTDVFLSRKEKIDVYLMADVRQELTLLQSLVNIIMKKEEN